MYVPSGDRPWRYAHVKEEKGHSASEMWRLFISTSNSHFIDRCTECLLRTRNTVGSRMTDDKKADIRMS
jgi:hypothetical protein